MYFVETVVISPDNDVYFKLETTYMTQVSKGQVWKSINPLVSLKYMWEWSLYHFYAGFDLVPPGYAMYMIPIK